MEDTLGPRPLVRPVLTQLHTLTRLLRCSTGPHRDALVRVVAEWTVFTGRLHAAIRSDATALTLLAQAEDIADEIGDGMLAALAVSFRGLCREAAGQAHGRRTGRLRCPGHPRRP